MKFTSHAKTENKGIKRTRPAEPTQGAVPCDDGSLHLRSDRVCTRSVSSRDWRRPHILIVQWTPKSNLCGYLLAEFVLEFEWFGCGSQEGLEDGRWLRFHTCVVVSRACRRFVRAAYGGLGHIYCCKSFKAPTKIVSDWLIMTKDYLSSNEQKLFRR